MTERESDSSEQRVPVRQPASLSFHSQCRPSSVHCHCPLPAAMSDNRRAPDIEQRLLDAHRAQQQHRQRHQAGAEQAGGSGHEDEAAQQPFLSASEERLSRLLGRLLTVTLSDQRTYCGRLYCIDRLSLLLSEAVQTVPRAAQHAAMDRSHAPPVDSLTGDERAGQWYSHSAHSRPNSTQLLALELAMLPALPRAQTLWR